MSLESGDKLTITIDGIMDNDSIYLTSRIATIGKRIKNYHHKCPYDGLVFDNAQDLTTHIMGLHLHDKH